MRQCIYAYGNKAVIDIENGASVVTYWEGKMHPIDVMRTMRPETRDWRVISLDLSYREKMKPPL